MAVISNLNLPRLVCGNSKNPCSSVSVKYAGPEPDGSCWSTTLALGGLSTQATSSKAIHPCKLAPADWAGFALNGVSKIAAVRDAKAIALMFPFISADAVLQRCYNNREQMVRPRRYASPVGTMAAVSTIRMTARSGARVRCLTPLGTTNPCCG